MQCDPEQFRKYRSHVTRCLFLSQDRADRTFSVNELCQKMSDPPQHSIAKIETTRSVLEGREAMDPGVQFGDVSSEVTNFSDSDWAGDKETRKSSSAGVALVGRDLLKAFSRNQKIIARSSAEGELYAAAFGSVRSEGCREHDE